MVAKITERKREAAASFAGMFDGDKKPSPEQVVVAVMHGTANGKKYTDKQLEAAKLLLPYRLPKLASVEAHVATTELSHEDWIASLDGED